LLAGSAIGLFGWDVNKPETLKEVNTKGHTEFVSKLGAGERKKRWVRWQRAVERSRGWDDHWDDEDDDG
jgi:glycerol kinase